VGSEGTLAVATKLILRLLRAPESVKTMLAIYDSIEEAGSTVSAIIGAGIVPATLEMMDKVVMGAVEASVQVGYPLDAEAVLIIELDGLADGMERQGAEIVEICRRHGVREIKIARDDAERARLWAGRKGAFGAVTRLKPSYMVCDGTVPRTKLPEVLRRVKETADKYDVLIGNVFHAGDGNLHPLILFDERNAEELERVKQASSEILKICAEAGGTISGEHGIGVEKLEQMHFVFSATDIAYMARIKQAFDPQSVLNPGKVLPLGEAGAAG
jgi:FAD/FMN-containing dehydrogenase